MHRALLKLLVWTVCERWVRCMHAFETRYAPRLLADDQLAAADKALLHDATTRLNTIATLWTKEPALARFLFEDAPADASKIHGFLEQSVYSPYRMIKELSPWLLSSAGEHANLPTVPTELPLLWRDVLDEEARMQLGYRPLVWVKEGEQRYWATSSTAEAALEFPTLSSHMVVERLSVLDAQSPLDWTGTLRGAAWRWANQQVERASLVVLPGKKSFLNQFRSATEAQRAHGTRLLAEAALMQWIGPVWYLQSLLNGLLGKSSVWLQLVEPTLFYGLGFINQLDPSIVKLHESVERYRSVLAPLFDSADLPTLSQDDLQQLWETVDDCIPEIQRFTPRHLERAQHLTPILGNNLLIAARPLYPMDAVRERLEALYTAEDSEAQQQLPSREAVYSALNMTTELPNAPREIITAGWLDAMNNLPDTLGVVFNGSGKTALHEFGNHLRQKDFLLRKSLETTTLHEMLLTRTS